LHYFPILVLDMSEEEKALHLLPAKSIGRILHVLHSAQQRNAFVPYTRFYLNSGQTIAGWLLAMGEDQGSTWLLIRTSENIRTITTDVSYVALNTVTAITLHFVGGILPSLSFGAITMPPNAEVPSRLQLRQKLQELHDRFRDISFTIAWESFPDQDQSRYQLGEMLTVLAVVLDGILATDLGREAIRAEVSQICLGYAPSWHMEKDNKTINIYFAITPAVSELTQQLSRLI
jgi:hypothetical protein